MNGPASVDPVLPLGIDRIEDVALRGAEADLTHAQRADVIHAAMIRAGLYASRGLPPAVGSSLLSSAVTGRCGGGLAPGAAVHQGLFLASDESDGEGSDLA